MEPSLLDTIPVVPLLRPASQQGREIEFHLRSQAVYYFEREDASNRRNADTNSPIQISAPKKLGEGRFGRVFLASQRVGGQKYRWVAIKILHNRVTCAEERLFYEEIELHRKLTHTGWPYIVRIIDVLDLPTLAMCGCGKLYIPFCPSCHQQGRNSALVRQDLPGRACPSLVCASTCGFGIDGADIGTAGADRPLLGPHAKLCCGPGTPHATVGTLINFVPRPALVMELCETRLSDYRWSSLRRYCEEQGLYLQANNDPFFEQLLALDKMNILLKLIETVAWLHGVQQVVHRDLTPDNIMVRWQPWPEAQIKQAAHSPQLLYDLMLRPRSMPFLIDFGFATQKDQRSSWYQEMDGQGPGFDKTPYYSPEALARFDQYRDKKIHFEQQPGSRVGRFLIPPEMLAAPASVEAGDTLVAVWDEERQHDLLITAVEPATRWAHYEGVAPPSLAEDAFRLIPPIGEAHDVFTLGAVAYHLFSEQHPTSNGIRAFIALAQRRPVRLDQPLNDTTLRGLFHEFCKLIRHPNSEIRRDLMMLILRAMVRTPQGGYCASRTVEGPGPALQMLEEARRIYHCLQHCLLTQPAVQQGRRLALVTSLSAAMVGASAALAATHWLLR